MEPFIGQLVMFGGNFAPRGWALCDGQLLPIAQNSALFSILGTTYGGDGRTSFGLPDLRGRFPLHPGNGPGLNPHRLGEKAGRTEVGILTTNLPSHKHDARLQAGQVQATSSNPNDKVLAGAAVYEPSPGQGTLVPLSSDSIAEQSVGGNIPIDVHNPYQAVNFIIALQGVFPSRS